MYFERSTPLRLFCFCLLVLHALLSGSVLSASADTLSDELLRNSLGVWPSTKIPLKYKIDDSLANEASEIRKAFSTWQATGSRITFKEDPDSNVSLQSPPSPDVVLVTKKSRSELPSPYNELIGKCVPAYSVPVKMPGSDQFYAGTIILMADPRTSLCLPAYWSTSNKLLPLHIDVQTAMLHEIGHLVGLPHPEDLTSSTIMGSTAAAEIHRELFSADVDAIRRLYGNQSISQSRQSGPPGATSTLSGSGFTPLHKATLHFQKENSGTSATITLDVGLDGKFTYQKVFPLGGGTYEWWARDEDAESDSPHLKFTVAEAVPITTGNIYGRVHAYSATGTPLPGTTVSCSGRITTTGTDGSFFISGVPSGNQEVTFSKTGYASYARGISVTPGVSTDIGDRWLLPLVVAPTPPAGTPDLAVHALSIHKPNGDSTHKLYLAPGETFVIDVDISNRGTAEATDEFRINYLLSDDDRIESSDSELGHDDVRTNVKAGRIYSDTKRDRHAPSTPGTYYIGASVRSGQDTNTLNDYSRGDDERAKIVVAIPNRSPEGWLDSASCDVIAGWTRDPDTTSAIQVHFYSDGPAGIGNFQGAASAGILRGDLPFADKNHGFVFQTPSSLKDGQGHSIYAYGIDSAGGVNPLLSGSPKSIICNKVQTGSVFGVLREGSFIGPVLSGVTVSCDNTTTTTGPDGAYSLSGIALGQHSLAFAKNGFNTVIVTITITNDVPVVSNGFLISSDPVGIITLPKTDQKACYDDTGAIVSCAGTGQDGELQYGLDWPNPRFTDNGDQTLLDNLTGLIWTKDANVLTTLKPLWDADDIAQDGAVSWQHALDFIKILNNENYLGCSDWRLPNVNELETLPNKGQASSADWLKSQGFSNIAADFYYWSSTTYENFTPYAWYVNMDVGSLESHYKISRYFKIWPVRSGGTGSGSSPTLPKTGQSTCYDENGGNINCTGTGQDGELQVGVFWPTQRFSFNADQTVTDNLTGLIWSKDANVSGYATTWQKALEYIKVLNGSNYLGYDDWRLPNVNELKSLANRGNSDIDSAHWLTTQGFSNILTNPWYWTSSSCAQYYGNAWYIYMIDGGVNGGGYKLGEMSIWPVRGGQHGTSTGNIQLPQTGQTSCYDAAGAVTSCSGTGQDGEYQSGALWPNPRFSDNGECVIDNLTGLMWPKDGSMAGGLSWQAALGYVASINSSVGICGYHDWHLPNVNELESLVNANEADNASWLSNYGIKVGDYNNWYWSATADSGRFYTDTAIHVNLRSGIIHPSSTGTIDQVFPVRIAQRGTITLPKTGQTRSYGLGDDGDLQLGAPWATPRFLTIGDGAVTDSMTGLMWSQDANLIKTRDPSFDSDVPDGNVSWRQALDYIKKLNLEKYLGFTDWRLPNRNELRSLVSYSDFSPDSNLPKGHPFTNISLGWYWSSSLDISSLNNAWIVGMSTGYMISGMTSGNSLPVWPVRGGI